MLLVFQVHFYHLTLVTCDKVLGKWERDYHLYYAEETEVSSKSLLEPHIKCVRSDKVSYFFVCVSFKSEIGTLVELIRNEIGSFVERWMDLESVIQSEVSQNEKKSILTHICGI